MSQLVTEAEILYMYLYECRYTCKCIHPNSQDKVNPRLYKFKVHLERVKM